jgi:hypothetical protein
VLPGLMRILSVAGSGLLRHCNESVFESLKFAFPDHGWNVWRLGVVKMGWWKDAANQRSFLDAVASDLNVHTLEDWYTVSREDLMRVGGAFDEPNPNRETTRLAASCLRPCTPGHLAGIVPKRNLGNTKSLRLGMAMFARTI